MATSAGPARPVGTLIREWRQRRRLSQLQLALQADISARHLSFLETGRSRPSRDMVLRMGERLDIPLRDRNALLLAAGYAPMFHERPLQDPLLSSARRAVDMILRGHEPYPALAVDRHWFLVASNATVAPFLTGVSPSLLQPPVNVLRLSLHPEGLAPRIDNLPEWRSHVLARLRRQVDHSADPVLADLLRELQDYGAPVGPPSNSREDETSVVIPLRLLTDDGILSFISTTTVFGTPVDITLSELALETFFPMDETTASALRALAEKQR